MPFPFSLCMKRTSHVSPFQMVFSYLVTAGWIVDVSLCENSINKKETIRKIIQHSHLKGGNILSNVG